MIPRGSLEQIARAERIKHFSANTLLPIYCAIVPVSERDIIGHSRQKHTSFYRHGFCYVAHQKQFTSHQIASMIDKDHSSVIYGYQRIKPLMEQFYAQGVTPQEYDLPLGMTPAEYRIRKAMPEIIKLRDNLPRNPQRTLDVLCKKIKADKELILSDSNKIEAAFFRQVWLYLLREQNLPYTRIAELSGRVRSTAIHAVQKIGPMILAYEQDLRMKQIRQNLEREAVEAAISSSPCQK